MLPMSNTPPVSEATLLLYDTVETRECIVDIVEYRVDLVD
jgi:hypothetical protein